MHTTRGHRSPCAARGGKLVGAWVVSVPVIAYTLCALTMRPPAQAAVFNIPVGDVAALITAINMANGNGEDDTITLAAGTYTLTAVDNDTEGPNGLPSITSHLTLTGAGAAHTVIAREVSAPLFRLVYVAASGHLRIEGLTLIGGLNGFQEGEGAGGGLFNAGMLILTHSTVRGNQSRSGGGLSNLGTLRLIQSTVRDNLAQYGAGLDNAGRLTLSRSTVQDNRAGGIGATGGGIFNSNSGRLWLASSTVSGNISDYSGGIFNDGITVLSRSTVSGNVAEQEPAEGAIANSGGLLFQNSIITGTCVNAALLISRGHNLVMVGGCPADPSLGDLTVDPATVFTQVLGPLQDNGGPTFTHALLPGSPAIDAGDPERCFGWDQRAVPRPQGAGCDIGAFELEVP